MNAILADNLQKINSLCEEHNVKSMYAFGSVNSDKFSETSDVDILVSFKPMSFGDYADAFFDLAEDLEEVFQRPVDLITEKSLSNPFFIQSIEQSKIRLYG